MANRNPYVATALEIAEVFNLKAVSVEYGGKHPKVVIDLGSRVIRHPFPGTPSDRRSLLNWRAQFRNHLAIAIQGLATASNT